MHNQWTTCPKITWDGQRQGSTAWGTTNCKTQLTQNVQGANQQTIVTEKMATYVSELPTKIVILDRKGHGCLLTNKVANGCIYAGLT
jgi:hypothetical protein